MRWLREHSLYFAWVIALSGLFLSLYFGEVLKIEPCRLCWYQRMALFPCALFLGIATCKHDVKIGTYVLPLVILGALFAGYQTLSQHLPSLHVEALCDHSESCTVPIFLFGVISFPLLSTIGFALIALLLIFSQKSSSR